MSDNDLDLGFEVSSIKKSSNVYPKGRYRCVVETMKIEWNTAETIKNLNVRLAFVGGDLDGKKVFARHPVATTRSDDGMKTAVGMGLDRVKELGTACGVSGSNLGPCIGQEVEIELGVTPAKGGYDESNDVKKYLPAPKTGAAKPGAGAKAATSSAPTFLAKKKAAEAAAAAAKAAAEAAAKAAEDAENDTGDNPQTDSSGVPDDSDLPF
jgi:hypothetical protein